MSKDWLPGSPRPMPLRVGVLFESAEQARDVAAYLKGFEQFRRVTDQIERVAGVRRPKSVRAWAAQVKRLEGLAVLEERSAENEAMESAAVELAASLRAADDAAADFLGDGSTRSAS